MNSFFYLGWSQSPETLSLTTLNLGSLKEVHGSFVVYKVGPMRTLACRMLEQVLGDIDISENDGLETVGVRVRSAFTALSRAIAPCS